MNEFVATGKPTEEIKRAPREKVAAQAPPLEVKDDKPLKDVNEGKTDAPAEIVADDIDDSQVSQQWSPEVLAEIARKNQAINKKHRAMKEAREAAQDAEEFGRAQWNEKRLMEERATRLEQELAELKAKVPQAPKVERVKPDPQKFYDDKGQFKAFEYAEELAAYSAAKAVEDDRTKQAEEKRRESAATAEALARTRMAEAEKKYPDFREVMAASTVRTHNAVLEYLTASDHIGEVSYYLEKNPD
ncbi:MAG: hypothetical protein WAM62_02385, partial [Pseudolabrys sp.]